MRLHPSSYMQLEQWHGSPIPCALRPHPVRVQTHVFPAIQARAWNALLRQYGGDIGSMLNPVIEHLDEKPYLPILAWCPFPFWLMPIALNGIGSLHVSSRF